MAKIVADDALVCECVNEIHVCCHNIRCMNIKIFNASSINLNYTQMTPTEIHAYADMHHTFDR